MVVAVAYGGTQSRREPARRPMPARGFQGPLRQPQRNCDTERLHPSPQKHGGLKN